MKCRWDRDAAEYLIDGEPCTTDEYGDPTSHCTARRTCSVHVGRDELTCPRCIGRTRAHIQRIPILAAFALPVAVASGVNSPAANLAGPSAHPILWMWRKVDARREAASTHLGESWDEDAFERAVERIEEDDDRHPAVVIRWAAMIAEDYDHDVPEVFTVTSAADYLGRNLARIANDREQDFPLLAREMRKCRQHMEVVESLSTHRERGVRCPDCPPATETTRPPRLVREYGHWCEDADCTRLHYDDDSEDRWVCPRDRTHVWSHADYEARIMERKARTA